MTVLNWTGLLVNGMVAFILPLVLALHAGKRLRGGYAAVSSVGAATSDSSLAEVEMTSTAETGGHQEQEQEQLQEQVEEQEQEQEQLVQPLWSCLEPAKSCIIHVIIAAFAATIIVTCVVDVLDDTPTD